MRIAELSVFHVRIRLKKPIRHASHSRTDTDSLIVRCRLDEGSEGFGEGLPRDYVTGETIEDALVQVRDTNWKSQLGGSFSGLSEAIVLCDQIALVRPEGARDSFGNSLRCAVELSVLDAVARAEGVPLSHVTALVPEALAIAKPSEQVRYSGAITTSKPLGQFMKAWKMKLFGFHQVKVKVGAADIDDVVALRRIRGILGPNVDLRLDANEAWTCETLEAQLAPLLP